MCSMRVVLSASTATTPLNVSVDGVDANGWPVPAGAT